MKETNPYIGVVGVFLGAGIATLNARLLGIGLADLRGATGLGFDQAAWLPTALGMASMFSGVFAVFLNALYGTRRILLPAAAIFGLASAVLPFSPTYGAAIALIVIAGISSGTFYSLTMTFVLSALPKKLILLGIAAYAAEIVFVSNSAAALQGWFAETLSWRWIFWTSAVVAPLMMVCIWFGIPHKQLPGQVPSWRGFVYFSTGAALIYGALDQGERLDWFNSGVIVALFAGGAFLIAATIVHRLLQPNSVLDLTFLNRRNIVILALSVFAFRFVHLATIVLIPGFLGNIQQYRAIETGRTLSWVAAPMFGVVWLAAALVVFINPRIILGAGLTIVAVCALICSRVDTSWIGENFQKTELWFAFGFALAYVALVSCLVLEALQCGVTTSVTYAATYSGFIHLIRIFGGQIGVTAMTRYLSVQQKLHSNLLGLHVETGNWLTDDRIRLLTAGMLPNSAGPEEAGYRAVALLGQQVRAQAYTLATADAFRLIAWVVVGYLVLMMFLRPGMTFLQLRNMK